MTLEHRLSDMQPLFMMEYKAKLSPSGSLALRKRRRASTGWSVQLKVRRSSIYIARCM